MSLLLFTFLDVEEGGEGGGGEEGGGGFVGFPAEEVSHNYLWRREIGDTGPGVRLARLAPFGHWDDWTVISGQSYQYQAQVFGLNGTYNWSGWGSSTFVPPGLTATAAADIVDAGTSGAVSADIIDGGTSSTVSSDLLDGGTSALV